MTRKRLAYAATTMGAAALALGACSSGGGAAKTVTVTATPSGGSGGSSAPVSVAPTATQAAVSGLPTPPSGSTALQTSNTDGVQYARYSTTSQQPPQVVAYYTQQWQNQGYTMTQSGGGGGGWGKYGGADAGATGTKSGSYVDVQAGGSTSGPTYFEVCMGADQSAVNNCGNQSHSGSS